MNEELDRRGAQAAADLLAEVTSSETESVLASIRSGATTVGVVASPAQGRRPSTVMLAAAAAVVLLLVGGLWLAMRDDADEIESVTTSAPSTSVPDTGVVVATTTPGTTATSVAPVTAPPSTAPPSTVPPTTAPPTTVPVDPGVELPLDVQRLSVVDASTMWAWGGAIQDNPGPNGHLMRSTDGGTTWTDVGGTDTSTLGAMAFADATNGWIVTAQGLLSTHDGGATWTPVDLGGAGGETVALAAHGARVHVVAFGSAGFAVLTSPIGSDDFTSSGLTIQPGAGPAADFSFAWAGDEGWLTYNDRTLISAAHFDGTTWAAWDLTCDVGPATVWSSGQPGAVDVDCDAGMWGNGTQTELRRSTDGGATFTDIPLPFPDDPGQYLDVRAVTPDGNIVAVVRLDVAPAVVVTSDRGTNWADPAWPLVPDTMSIANGRWVATGRATVDEPAGVWVSNDQGATWTETLSTVTLVP